MDTLFEKYMVTKPGEKPFLTLDSFRQMFIDIKINLNDEIVGHFFNFAMSIQIDESKLDAHIKMRQKLEFYEAYSRAIDSLTTFEYTNSNIE